MIIANEGTGRSTVRSQAIVMSAGRQIRQASKQTIKNEQCGSNHPKGVQQANSHNTWALARQGGYLWPIANCEQRYATQPNGCVLRASGWSGEGVVQLCKRATAGRFVLARFLFNMCLCRRVGVVRTATSSAVAPQRNTNALQTPFTSVIIACAGHAQGIS